MATRGQRAAILLAVLFALAAAARAAPPAASQTPAPGAPVCGTSPSAGTVCIITGSGTVPFREPGGGFAYLTSAPVSPDSVGASAPAGTELEIQPQSNGTVTIDPMSVTISVDPGSIPQLDVHGSGLSLAGCALLDGSPNTIRCPFTPDPSTTAYPQLSFSTRAGPVAAPAGAQPQGSLGVTVHDSGEQQPTDVSEAGRKLLIDPNTLALLALTLETSVGVDVTWDGNQFIAEGSDGSTVAVSPADGCQSGAVLPDPNQSYPPHLYPASTISCSPVTGGALDVTLTPPPTVDRPGATLLSPGDALRFEPSPAAAAAEQAAAARRATPSLLLINDTDENLDVDPEDSGLSASAPSGASLEILRWGQPQSCSAADATASTIACTWPDAAGADLHLSILAPGNAALSLSMPPTTNAWLFLPAAEAGGTAQMLSVSNLSDQTASAVWDGSTLTVSVANPTGGALATDPALSDWQQLGLPEPAACQTTTDQPNAITCTTPAPSSTVSFRSVTPPPPDGATFPYSDTAGAGTLAGPAQLSASTFSS